ncbi:MAG TPA: hypothetical protein VIB48_03580 [Acidimicrobiia bacterium]|jgi:hypothetical protein
MHVETRTFRNFAALLMLACLVAFGTTTTAAVLTDTASTAPATGVHRTSEHLAVVNGEGTSAGDLLTTLRRLAPSGAVLVGVLAALLLMLVAGSRVHPGAAGVVSRRTGALPGRRGPPHFAT